MLLIIKKFPNKLLQMPKQYLEDKEFVLTALHIYDRGIFNPQNKYIYAEIVFRLLSEKLRIDKDILEHKPTDSSPMPKPSKFKIYKPSSLLSSSPPPIRIKFIEGNVSNQTK